LTDRGSVSLTPDFGGRTPLPGVPAWGGEGIVCLMPEPSAGAFDGAPFDCSSARDIRPKMAVPAPRFDAFAAGVIADAGGDSRTVVAVREPSGKLKLKMRDAPPYPPGGTFGAQLAVGDLDQDGTPEIAVSADALDDAVDIWTWPSEGAALRPRLHLAAPAGVRALAVCPPEEHGVPVLVAVVGNEVWLVRADLGGSP
ncbi:MAG TPA: FG-GAP repeat protein, partial [Polyangiaceae bacterium]|nr:FG-GAP repeat protein [Polyangiaceae bacterium]